MQQPVSTAPRQPPPALGAQHGRQQQQAARPTPDRRTALQLMAASPMLPDAADLFQAKAEQPKQQFLLQTQDALHETALWTRELLTPLESSSSARSSSSSSSQHEAAVAACKRLAEKRPLVQAEAHGEEVRGVRDGAARLVADVVRHEGAVADAQDRARGLPAAKRVHGGDVHLVEPALLPQVVVPIAMTVAQHDMQEPSSGTVQL